MPEGFFCAVEGLSLIHISKFSPPDFPITRWLLGFASVTPRVVGTYVERTRYRYRGVSKGVMLDPVSYTHLDVYKRQWNAVC